MNVTYNEAHALFRYDPESGLLIRRKTVAHNAQKGDVAGSVDRHGYIRVRVGNKHYPAHRIITMMMTGFWPENEVDHVNGCRTDNSWSNLRAATRQQNAHNQKKPCDNTSGFKGVTKNKRTGKWQAALFTSGKSYYLGSYTNPEEASQAYNGAAALVFGEFMRKESK